MSKGSHPKYNPVVFVDMTTGARFVTRSTKTSKRKEIIDGVEHFVIPLGESSSPGGLFVEKPNANLHVVRNLMGGWSVKRSGASRASKTFAKQTEAIVFARKEAKKEQGVLIVHSHDGAILQRISYGTDASRSQG